MGDWFDFFDGNRAWVTGASSGIGEALVRLLGEAGVGTLASARRTDRLEALAEQYPSVRVFPLDLANREGMDEAAMRAWDMMDGIDFLFNNAGISQRSAFLDADPQTLEHVIAINLLGTMRLTHAAASRMIPQGQGHIITITSLAAKVPPPRRTAYAASKAALHAMFDSMRTEFTQHNIDITLAVPGYVKTEISHHAVTGTGEKHGRLDENQAGGHSAESCAHEILNATAKRRREVYVAMTPKLRLALFLRTVAPGLLWRLLPKASNT